MFFVYISSILVSIVFALFFGFKYKQVEGADYKNKRLRDRHGSGSFSTALVNFVAKIFWASLTVVSIIVGLICFGKINDLQSPSKKELMNSSLSNNENIKAEEIKKSNKNIENLKIEKSTAITDNTPSNLQAKNFTDQDIKELEDKVQYHGDDPVIRSRLGLPDKKQ
jgi:hypothetical protein